MCRARSSNLLRTITILLIICCCSLSAQGKYGGGTGTPEDPYQIWDANHMQAIGPDANDWDKHFKLMADIDLSGFDGKQGRPEFNIIGGFSGDPFRGVFDGNEHTISNFTYDSNATGRVGLFGNVESGEVRDLRLIDPNVDARTGHTVGSLIARLSGGTVRRCCAEGGSVNGDDDVGGLVGENQGTVVESYSTAVVSSTGVNVGGLVGDNVDGQIHNCYSRGNVSGIRAVGGLVGRNLEVEWGGRCGWSRDGSITTSYSTGAVIGTTDTSGLVGKNRECGECCFFECIWICESPECEPDCCWEECFEDCWDECHNANVVNSFWDVNTSGQSGGEGGEEKSTVQMQQQATYANWDFDDVWGICEERAYPHLLWQKAGLLCSEDMVGFAILGQAWGSSPNDANWNPAFNLYEDDSIDMVDVALFFDQWLGVDRLFEVPNVVDINQTDGHSLIIAAHLTVGDEVFDYNETVRQFVVLSQDPAAATLVQRFSQVNLVISDGPCPKVSVPDLTDMNETQAHSILLASGLELGAVIPEPNGSVAEGHVIRQDPSAGTLVCTGSAVHIIVSSDLPGGMELIPAAEFEMGDHHESRSADDVPVHTVHLDSFHIGKYEVTNAEYCEYLNSAKSRGLIDVTPGGEVYPVGGTEFYFSLSGSQIAYSGGIFEVVTRDSNHMSNHPVVTVTWYGAAAYCNWLSDQAGYEQCYDTPTWECDFTKYGYRLPTEAEWEYAAHAYVCDRGGCIYYLYPWSTDNIDCALANYQNPSGYCNPLNLSSQPYTSPVGYYPDHGYGLYDMAGNVFEWCNDWYGSDYYSVSPYLNPTGPASGSDRIVRGGAWVKKEEFCRAATRFKYSPDTHGDTIGFRLVLDLE